MEFWFWTWKSTVRAPYLDLDGEILFGVTVFNEKILTQKFDVD